MNKPNTDNTTDDMHKYRIAYVTSIHSDYDARVWKYATAVAEQGCSVHLICPWAISSGDIVSGVTCHTFRRVGRRFLRPFLNPFRVFRKLLPVLHKVDIVHFHDIDLLPFMAVLSFFKPVVYDVHENYADEMLVRDWIPKRIRNILYHLVYHGENACVRIIRNVVIVSPSQADKFSRLSTLRIIKIFNYASSRLLVDSKALNYMQRSDQVVFIGTNYESNGSYLLLDIAKCIQKTHPHVRFLMVDRFQSSAFRKSFLCRLSEFGLENHFNMVANVAPHELMPLLNLATIAIAPNLRVPKQEKAIPNKLFEYLAASLPVVSSDLPYARKIFEGEKIGILAQPEDPESFVRAIIRLINDRSFAKQMGKSGHSEFEKLYSWESQMPSLMAFYEEIAGDRRIAQTNK